MADNRYYDGSPRDLASVIEARDDALTVSDFARILACSDKQLYKLAAKRILPHFRVGSSIRPCPHETAEWLRAHHIGAKDSSRNIDKKISLTRSPVTAPLAKDLSRGKSTIVTSKRIGKEGRDA